MICKLNIGVVVDFTKVNSIVPITDSTSSYDILIVMDSGYRYYDKFNTKDDRDYVMNVLFAKWNDTLGSVNIKELISDKRNREVSSED